MSVERSIPNRMLRVSAVLKKKPENHRSDHMTLLTLAGHLLDIFSPLPSSPSSSIPIPLLLHLPTSYLLPSSTSLSSLPHLSSIAFTAQASGPFPFRPPIDTSCSRPFSPPSPGFKGPTLLEESAADSPYRKLRLEGKTAFLDRFSCSGRYGAFEVSAPPARIVPSDLNRLEVRRSVGARGGR